jgi:PAS domain S-box-containing protein
LPSVDLPPATPVAGATDPGLPGQLALLDAIPDAVFVLRAIRDGDGVIVDEEIVYANAGALAAITASGNMANPALADIVGRSLLSLFPAAAARFAVHRRILETGEAAPGEGYQSISGRWFEISYSTFGDGLVSVSRDTTDRVHAEQALRASEAELRAAQALGRVGSWTLDVATGATTWSDGMWAIYGLDRSQPKPTEAEYSRFFDPETLQLRRGWIARAIATGESYHELVDIHRADGRIGHLSVHGEAIRDAVGVITGLRSLVLDVTAIREAEEAVRDSEAMFRGVFEENPEAIVVVRPVLDGTGAFADIQPRYANQVARLRYFDGISNADLIAGPGWERWPQHRHLVFDLCAEVIRTGLPVTREFHTPRPEGEYWSDVRIFPFEDGLALIGRDITLQRRAEQALRENEARYRALVEGIPGIVYAYSTARGGLYYSPRCLEVLGYPPERLLAEPMLWHDSIHPDDVAAVDAAITGAAYDEAIGLEYRIRDVSGAWRWLDDRSTRYRVSGDEAILEGFALEITARKRAEAEREQMVSQLEQAQKLESIGRLAGGVAHDFNNMLGAIIGHTDLALEGLGPDSPIRYDLEEVRAAANRSADLTRQLLAFARKQTVAPRVISLNEAISGQLAMLRRLIGEDIELAWRPVPDVCHVRIDPSQVDQLLANLCVNARDAIAGIGRIEIATANATPAEIAAHIGAGVPAGDVVRLSVDDNGPGIAPEVLARIFEPFFTTKRAGEGTGLGLAIVHGIASQNGGWVEVRTVPGEGSTFDVFLPAAVGGELEATATVPTRAGGGGETILLVEDEAVILRLTAAMLTRLGYRVLLARAPSIALQLAAEHADEIDLLVVDVVMPEMNGNELVRILLATRPDLPHLYISGYTADVIAQHGVLGEGIHFLQKPFTATMLDVAVRAVLDER